MKLKCKKGYIGYGNQFNVGQFYEVLEKRSNAAGTEYWLFRISGTTKANSIVESLPLSEVYNYFETLEETRN